MEVFELTGGSINASCKQGDVELALGIANDVAEDVFDYLHEEGLIEVKGMGNMIGLTHRGRLSVEDALRERPTKRPVGFQPR